MLRNAKVWAAINPACSGASRANSHISGRLAAHTEFIRLTRYTYIGNERHAPEQRGGRLGLFDNSGALLIIRRKPPIYKPVKKKAGIFWIIKIKSGLVWRKKWNGLTQKCNGLTQKKKKCGLTMRVCGLLIFLIRLIRLKRLNEAHRPSLPGAMCYNRGKQEMRAAHRKRRRAIPFFTITGHREDLTHGL